MPSRSGHSRSDRLAYFSADLREVWYFFSARDFRRRASASASASAFASDIAIESSLDSEGGAGEIPDALLDD